MYSVIEYKNIFINTHLLNTSQRFRLLWKVASMFRTGSTFKCCNTIAFDYNSINNLYLFCSLRNVYFIIIKQIIFYLCFQEVKLFENYHGSLFTLYSVWIQLCLWNICSSTTFKLPELYGNTCTSKIHPQKKSKNKRKEKNSSL